MLMYKIVPKGIEIDKIENNKIYNPIVIYKFTYNSN